MKASAEPKAPGAEALPPGLMISPIESAAAPPPRLLAGLCTLLAFSSLSFGARRAVQQGWLMPKLPEEVLRIRTVTLVLSEDAGSSELPGEAGESGADSKGESSSLEPELNNLAITRVVSEEMETFEPLLTRPLAELPHGQLPQVVDIPKIASGLGVGSGTGGGGKGGGKGHGGGGSGTGGGVGLGAGIRSIAGMEGILIRAKDVQVLRQELPDYPIPALMSRTPGEVIVHCTIDAQGIPVGFDIVSGPQIFHREIRRVVPLWRFKPLPQLGPNTQVRLEMIFRFRIW